MPKTDRPWLAVWPGDTNARNIPIGTDVPPSLMSKAIADRVIPYEATDGAPEVPLSDLKPRAARKRLDGLADPELAQLHREFAGRAPHGRASRDTVIDAILTALPED